MIVAAFMTLQQGIFDLSCLPTQPASDAVFHLKPIFPVAVLHALAEPYSNVLHNFCALGTFTAGDLWGCLRT